MNCFRCVISTETDNKQLETFTIKYHCRDMQMQDEFPCNLLYVASSKNISLSLLLNLLKTDLSSQIIWATLHYACTWMMGVWKAAEQILIKGCDNYIFYLPSAHCAFSWLLFFWDYFSHSLSLWCFLPIWTFPHFANKRTAQVCSSQTEWCNVSLLS